MIIVFVIAAAVISAVITAILMSTSHNQTIINLQNDALEAIAKEQVDWYCKGWMQGSAYERAQIKLKWRDATELIPAQR